MNKQEIEKAIDVLDGNKEGFENLLKDQPDHPMRGHIEHQIDCLKVAISALEKQIPKKPIIRSWSPAKCPSCGMELSESLGDGYYKHSYGLEICNCGQKLSWDEM